MYRIKARNWSLILFGVALLSASNSTGEIKYRPAKFDFNGDGRSELAVYANGVWTVGSIGVNYTGKKVLGNKDSQPMPGIFNYYQAPRLDTGYDKIGAVVADAGVYNDGIWTVQSMQESLWTRQAQFGFKGATPVPGDYDGDGVTDLAVFYKGTWYISQTKDGFRQANFGFDGAHPLVGDFNGDGRDDLCVVWDNPSTKKLTWAIHCSPTDVRTFAFGDVGAIPVPGHYTGSAWMNPAYYWVDPNTKVGSFYISSSSMPNNVKKDYTFPLSGTGSPVGGFDFDGDGRDDIAVYNEDTGVWTMGLSSIGEIKVGFGYRGAKAVGASTYKQVGAHQPIIEPRAPGVMDGLGGFLWKPHSESNGKLLVLWPTNIDPRPTITMVVVSHDPAGEQVIERLNDHGEYSSGRWKFRAYVNQGSQFGNNVYVVAFFNNGRLPKPYLIPTGANRWD